MPSATQVTMELAFANGTIVEKVYIFTDGPVEADGEKTGTGYKGGGTPADAGELKIDVSADAKYTVLSQHHKTITVGTP
jgi:hypothetical protein